MQPSSLLLTILLILPTSHLLTTDPEEKGIIVEHVDSTPEKLFIRSKLDFSIRDDPFATRGTIIYPADICPPPYLPNEHGFEHSLAHDLDMRKMMGRWFVGLTSSVSYHSRLRYRKFGHDEHLCLVYEFGQMSLALHSTSFDVIMTYLSQSKRSHYTDYGKMVSYEPTNAQLQFTSSTHQYGSKFWIYAVGPLGSDSFGRSQYEYAIVGDCYMTYLQVLVRNPQTFNETYKNETISWLKDHHYEISERPLYQPAYYGCYLDSVTQTDGY